MRKFTFVFIFSLFILSFQLEAQVYKGLKAIGGSGGINYDSDDKLFSIGLFPSYGIFVSDQLLVEGTLGFSHSETNFSGNFTSFSLGPNVRYYFSPKAKQSAYFNVGGGLSLTSFNGTDVGYDLRIGPGMAFFLNESTSLDLGLQYSRSDGGLFSNNNLSLSVGFKIFLGKKKKE